MNPNADLSVRPSMHKWLPDETLLSFCSRHHRLYDHQRESDTCVELFGRPRHDAAHNLPSRVADFVERSGGSLATAEEIVRRRTVVAFYFPFLAQPRTAAVLEAALHGSVQTLRVSLGMPKSIFRSSPPLKACQSCMQIDREKFGVAYWHLQHQFPGTSYCLDHKERLGLWAPHLVSTSARAWPLPMRSTIDFTGTVDPAWDRDVHLKVTQLSFAIGTLDPCVRFHPGVLGAAYLEALRRKGLVRMRSNTLRRSSLGPDFSQHVLCLARSTDFREFPKGAACAATCVARLVRASQPSHPLWHIPLIAWLFTTWDEFCEAYDKARLC